VADRGNRKVGGSAKAKAKGVYKGRKPSVPVEEVRRLKVEGLGASAIAVRLGIARSSVYEALKGA
jgi:DNA invertase Pin-like site-specific DNA recombinase